MSDSWEGDERVVQRDRRNTHQATSVCTWVAGDVFRQGHTGHRIRNELEGISSDAQEGKDVRVREVSPHHCNLVEGLWVY